MCTSTCKLLLYFNRMSPLNKGIISLDVFLPLKITSLLNTGVFYLVKYGISNLTLRIQLVCQLMDNFHQRIRNPKLPSLTAPPYDIIIKYYY